MNFLIITRFSESSFYRKSKESYVVCARKLEMWAFRMFSSFKVLSYNFVNFRGLVVCAHLLHHFHLTQEQSYPMLSSFNCISTSSSHLLHYLRSFFFVFLLSTVTLPYFLFRRSYVQMLSTYINTLLQMEVEDTEEGMIWCDSGNIEAVWA